MIECDFMVLENNNIGHSAETESNLSGCDLSPLHSFMFTYLLEL